MSTASLKEKCRQNLGQGLQIVSLSNGKVVSPFLTHLIEEKSWLRRQLLKL